MDLFEKSPNFFKNSSSGSSCFFGQRYKLYTELLNSWGYLILDTRYCKLAPIGSGIPRLFLGVDKAESGTELDKVCGLNAPESALAWVAILAEAVFLLF
ncbi:hypothetical protein LPBF_06085 [Flavobacterium crassostreae]|uniref:Uncharacterized protein n=1 Tax=Flavobacterium crassostreae TaxID=1763534 RepID=A0A1B9E3K0_9FLAO|nr:hypothetical protein LPBF_06085 [Flavobacterium crassostreae]